MIQHAAAIFAQGGETSALSYRSWSDGPFARKDGDTVNTITQRFARSICTSLALVLSAIAPPGVAQDSIALVATGSSLPEPLYQAWGDEYHKQHPSVQLRYLPTGTGESAQEITSGTGDLGGGDAPISEKQLKEAAPILQLPTVLIGIAIVYNVPDTPGELRLTGPALADIFLGKVKLWSDAAIAKLNPGVKLPARPIQVIHRTDGKGSNYILSDFLCKVSPEFLEKAGRGESPKWPVGTSAARSQDMADRVRATPGSIGYTELNLAERASLRIARIKNSSGEFVKPTQSSIATAALAAKINDDFRISLTNAPGKESYPIVSFTWFYIPARAKDPLRGRAVADYLRWVYGDGQRIAQAQGYATLPKELLTRVAASTATIR